MIAFCTTAAAFTPQAGRTKVMVGYLFPQPNASAPAQLIVGSGGDVVHQYESGTLGYVPAPALAGLERAAAALGLSFIAKDDFDIVFLPGGAVDSRVGVEAGFPGKPLAPPYPNGQFGLYLVQFAGPIPAPWLGDLRATGAVPIQYVSYNSFIVAARPDQAEVIGRLAEVQFLDRFHPFLKPHRSLPSATDQALYVQIANVAGAEAVVDDVARRSSTAPDIHRAPDEILVTATLAAADADAILTNPLVYGVVPFPEAQLSDERVAMSMTRNVTGPPSALSPTKPGTYQAWLAEVCPYCTTLQADGFWVALADTGLDGGNPAVPGNENAVHHADLPNNRIRYGSNLIRNDPDTTLRDELGHGTFVAGAMAGNPSPSGAVDVNGFFWGTGVAPSSGVFITKIDVRLFSTTEIYFSAADARITPIPPVYVQNHSYNQYTDLNGKPVCDPSVNYYDGRYSIMSRNFDRAVIDADDQQPISQDPGPFTPITLVASAGNRHQQPSGAGCVDTRLALPPATAKNVIAMGDGREQQAGRRTVGLFYD